MKEHEHPYWWATDHAYAIRKHDGYPYEDSGYISKHRTEEAAKKAAANLAAKNSDSNYYHRQYGGEPKYKKGEVP